MCWFLPISHIGGGARYGVSVASMAFRRFFAVVRPKRETLDRIGDLK